MFKNAEDAKKNNILDMAITFTSMMRVFAKGSKERIAQKFWEVTSGLPAITVVDDYEQTHKMFCEWFCREIYTAQKTLKNGRIKSSQLASYGQAAKTLDIVLKVYIFYCLQPSSDVACRISRFLHGAVDTPIMNHLKRVYSDTTIKAITIEQVDKSTYQILQDLLARDIKDRFHGDVLPVQYDDIMWLALNRETEEQA